jgi:hypothetical protein
MPQTRLGWWLVGLVTTSVVLGIFAYGVFEVLAVPAKIRSVPWRDLVIPIYSITVFLCGLADGVVGLIAVLRRHERSALVWLAMVLGPAPLIPFIVEYLLYVLNSPWYSP